MFVASLATIPSRLSFLPRILDCLCKQSVKPDKIIVHYSRTPWHLDPGFSEPPAITFDDRVELIEVPNDGSCRKYVHTIERYRDTDTTIALVDDDIFWRNDVFERLLNCIDKDHVVTTRGWSQFEITRMCGVGIFRRGDPVESHKVTKLTQVKCASSGWATVFKANQVNSKFFDAELRSSIFLSHSDEVFLSHMLIPPKYVVPLDFGFYEKAFAPSNLCRAPETAIAKAKQIEILQWESTSMSQ